MSPRRIREIRVIVGVGTGISPFPFGTLRVFGGPPLLNSNRKNSELVARLLHWFAAHARDLPWRRTRDPYAIWVSEIMLQQTQVKTVIPFWERWMRALPDIASLANADTDQLHKLWEGLGYYTRVRNLQKAAQQMVTLSPADGKRNGVGRFPTEFDAVLALPGIGRYTAGAICSIAFNQPTPILDGNVIRVLTRIHGINTDPREKETNARLWRLAEELVTHAQAAWDARPREPHSGNFSPTRREPHPTNACSHLNQSLMELGALICTPRSPNCAACPVQKLCAARKRNLQDHLPNLGKRAAATARRFLAFVVERNGKFLVRQRPDGVLNAHLWEFPNVEIGAECGDPQRAAAALGVRVTSTRPFRIVKHSITRYRITLEAWRAGPAQKAALAGQWRSRRQLSRLAFTSAHRKILQAISISKIRKCGTVSPGEPGGPLKE